MRSFMREKKIYCGKHYREVDIYPYTAAQLTASTRGKRSKKIKETEPKQKNLNDKNARRYFTQTANLNFGSDPEALHVTATYSGKYLPDTVEQAEQEATNFLRRVQYRRKKEGLPPLKYMIVTAYTTKRNSETPVRIHHHIIMNGGLDRDVVEDLWRKRRRKGQKKGDKIGFCNADRLQADENGIYGYGRLEDRPNVGRLARHYEPCRRVRRRLGAGFRHRNGRADRVQHDGGPVRALCGRTRAGILQREHQRFHDGRDVPESSARGGHVGLLCGRYVAWYRLDGECVC